MASVPLATIYLDKAITQADDPEVAMDVQDLK
jgi:hypothetical protein